MYSKRKRSFRDLSACDTGNAEDECKHHDGSIGTYISTKRRKLAHQFSAGITKISSMFSGHVVWINGYTQPPMHELKELIIEHGGMVELTLTKQTTAMIADNLPMSKLKHYSQTNSSLIIATPQWIVQSVAADHLLNPSQFRLLDALLPQKRSSSMFSFEAKADEGDAHSFASGVRSTLTDPDFVTNFFKSSRLHLIGSFKDVFLSMLPEFRAIDPQYDTAGYLNAERGGNGRFKPQRGPHGHGLLFCVCGHPLGPGPPEQAVRGVSCCGKQRRVDIQVLCGNRLCKLRGSRLWSLRRNDVGQSACAVPGRGGAAVSL